MAIHIRPREFISLLATTIAGLPAQQSQRMRRIGLVKRGQIILSYEIG
jgi:hypothetical protein